MSSVGSMLGLAFFYMYMHPSDLGYDKSDMKGGMTRPTPCTVFSPYRRPIQRESAHHTPMTKRVPHAQIYNLIVLMFLTLEGGLGLSP